MQPALWLLAVLTSPTAQAQPVDTSRPVLFVVTDADESLAGVAPTLMGCGGRIVVKDDGVRPDVAVGDNSWAGLAMSCPIGDFELSISRGSQTVWEDTITVAATVSGPSVRIALTADGADVLVQGDGGAEDPTVHPEGSTDAAPLGDEDGAQDFAGLQPLPPGSEAGTDPIVMSPEEALAQSGHEATRPGDAVQQVAQGQAPDEPGPPGEGAVPPPPEEGAEPSPESLVPGEPSGGVEPPPSTTVAPPGAPAPAAPTAAATSTSSAIWWLGGVGLLAVAVIGGLVGFGAGRRRGSSVKLEGPDTAEGAPFGRPSGRWLVPADRVRAASVTLAKAHRGPVLLAPADRELGAFDGLAHVRWLPREKPLPEELASAARAMRVNGAVLVIVEGRDALEPALPHHDADAVMDEVPEELGDIAHVLLVTEGDAVVTLRASGEGLAPA